MRVFFFNRLRNLLLLYFLSLPAWAQKQITQQYQFWVSTFHTIHTGAKWSLYTEFHLRTVEFDKRLSLLMTRPGILYHPVKDVLLGGGVGYLLLYPQPGAPPYSRNEIRPWQRIGFRTRWEKFSMIQMLTAEQRFVQIIDKGQLTNRFRFNHRFRFWLNWQHPIVSKLGWVIAQEILINAGPEINYNYFDQYRIQAGFYLKATSTSTFQLGYVYVFQALGSPGKYFQIDGLRVALVQNIEANSSP